MDKQSIQTLIVSIITLLGGTTLGYFVLPKKTKRNLEQNFTKELAARVTHLELLLDKSMITQLKQAETIGELRAEVAQCKELHRKVLTQKT